VSPVDPRCLKCYGEKRGCSFKEEDEEEEEGKLPAKRARRGTVKKEPNVAASVGAGPSRVLEPRIREYCSLLVFSMTIPFFCLFSARMGRKASSEVVYRRADYFSRTRGD